MNIRGLKIKTTALIIRNNKININWHEETNII